MAGLRPAKCFGPQAGLRYFYIFHAASQRAHPCVQKYAGRFETAMGIKHLKESSGLVIASERARR